MRLFRCIAIPLAVFLAFTCAKAFSSPLADSGAGEVLIFPFYTTQKGWDTYINVSPTTLYNPDLTSVTGSNPGESVDKSKPILHFKIRSGIDGSVIRSFTVLMKDTTNIRASISKLGEETARLKLVESGCVIDDQGNKGAEGFQLTLPEQIGSLEVYSVGYWSVPGAEWANCSSLMDQLYTTEWNQSVADTLAVDGTQKTIVGTGTLLNVDKGLSGIYEATALSGLGINEPVQMPGSESPSLMDAEGGIDLVAQMLDVNTLTNPMVLGGPSNANTNWVNTFPLTGYKNYKPVNDSDRWCDPFGTGDGGLESSGEDDSPYDYDATISATGKEYTRKIPYPRELGWAGGAPPRDRVRPLNNCFAINIIWPDSTENILAHEKSLLSSAYPLERLINHNSAPDSIDYKELSSGFKANLHWPKIEMMETGRDYIRPVLGFRITVYENGTLNGGTVLANYLKLTPHERHEAIQK